MKLFQRKPTTIDIHHSAAGGGASVPELVAARAHAHPGALALAADEAALSYRDLDCRANRLAHFLRAHGVGPDVLVGLCLPRSLDMVVGALGILKAGGAYVPLDPDYPAERLALMLEDAEAPVLVTNQHLAQQLPTGKRERVFLGDPRIAGQRADPPPIEIEPGDLAYVIYTSGSTGTPKGVEIAHRSLSNLVAWHDHTFAVTAADRASQVAGLAFDATVWEIWPYLAAGASVHFADEVTRNSAELLRDWMLAKRITVGFVPTPLLEGMLTLGWPSRAELRIVLTGGDMLHHYPPAGLPFTLVNNYGPTECTVVATSGPVPPDRDATTPPAIGRAIDNIEVQLLDEHLRPVAPGTPGEICVGGAGLARGYHKRRDLTAERFVPDPSAADASARLYRTGDLGRLLPDGQVAFLGRIDDQIKIRGYRIEPGEISSALNRHPDVWGSLVVAREDDTGNKRLVAYVMLGEDADLSHIELSEFLGDYLPDYMLPAAFVRLDAFPLTPHGKIDRAALPAPSPDNMLQDEVADGPRTDTEQRVAEILGELLELEEIGLDDNFFMLGGHSLLGAQVIARLRETFGVQIDLRSLFEAPTVASLSVEVDRLSTQRDAPSRNGGRPVAVSGNAETER